LSTIPPIKQTNNHLSPKIIEHEKATTYDLEKSERVNPVNGITTSSPLDNWFPNKPTDKNKW